MILATFHHTFPSLRSTTILTLVSLIVILHTMPMGGSTNFMLKEAEDRMFLIRVGTNNGSSHRPDLVSSLPQNNLEKSLFHRFQEETFLTGARAVIALKSLVFNSTPNPLYSLARDVVSVQFQQYPECRIRVSLKNGRVFKYFLVPLDDRISGIDIQKACLNPSTRLALPFVKGLISALLYEEEKPFFPVKSLLHLGSRIKRVVFDHRTGLRYSVEEESIIDGGDLMKDGPKTLIYRLICVGLDGMWRIGDEQKRRVILVISDKHGRPFDFVFSGDNELKAIISHGSEGWNGQNQQRFIPVNTVIFTNITGIAAILDRSFAFVKGCWRHRKRRGCTRLKLDEKFSSDETRDVDESGKDALELETLGR